jgi:hypothetical protein
MFRGISVENIRARAYQGNWQPKWNRNFRELLSAWVEHMLLNWAAQIKETAYIDVIAVDLLIRTRQKFKNKSGGIERVNQ